MSTISAFYLIFLFIVTCGYYALPARYRPLWLLGASYLFYFTWQPAFLLVLCFVTFVAFNLGRLLPKISDPLKKRNFLLGGIALLLLPLFTFKYLNQTNDLITAILDMFSVSVSFPKQPYLAPLGISFFTFLSIGYVADIYRGYLEPERSLHKFAVFVAFFPTILAGPIERAKSLLKQINAPRSFDRENIRAGLQLILWGVFKKVVIADRIAAFTGDIYAAPENFPGFIVYLAIVLSVFRVFCDFSGYSDIAVGSARLLGINVVKNFDDRVYAATSRQKFWQGWHMSLTSWIRDYVFLPLSKKVKTRGFLYFNLIFVFLLIGLWHGATWGFLIWGLLNGVWLVIERVTQLKRHKFAAGAGIGPDSRVYRFLSWLLVFHAGAFMGVFFLASSPQNAFDMFSAIANSNAGIFQSGELRGTALTIVFLMFMDLINSRIPKGQNFDRFIGKQHLVVRWIMYFVLAELILRYVLVFRTEGFMYFLF
ncbi:MAG: MBOAT family O-acyltransferase [Pyrinomonadaceae bacterium]